jgi:probable F420-dependent oxidoreductase
VATREGARLGIITPIVTLNPRAHNPWEQDAGVEELVTVAEAADRLGYHHLTCSEHVAVPVAAASQRGGRYWDPAATLAYLAARTSRIKLATHVLVLGYHHPLDIVKQYGTLDMLSGGRLILGVGVGSLQEEFALLGAPFEDRGVRADESLRTLRAAFGKQEFDGFVVDPAGDQTPPPIWIGGRTGRSLRRAVELGDGWVPFGLTTDDVAAMVRRCQETEAWTGRDRPLDIALWPEPPVDPIHDPDGFRRQVDAAVRAGATIVNLRFRSASLHHHLELMDAATAVTQA